MNPLCFGINCALGASQIEPFMKRLSSTCECFVSCYPNAGLPNSTGGYDDDPELMAKYISVCF